MANFGLVFPVSLVKDLYLVLEWDQCVGLTNPGELLLESIWEALINLLVECFKFVIPASAWCVLVEVKDVLDHLACVLVSQVLNVDSGIVDRVTWVKKTV